MVVVLIVPVNTINDVMLFPSLFLFGAAAGSANVAINTQASVIETMRGRATMSTFHGFFSLGALISAGVGGAMIARRLG
jgi:fucose permease